MYHSLQFPLGEESNNTWRKRYFISLWFGSVTLYSNIKMANFLKEYKLIKSKSTQVIIKLYRYQNNERIEKWPLTENMFQFRMIRTTTTRGSMVVEYESREKKIKKNWQFRVCVHRHIDVSSVIFYSTFKINVFGCYRYLQEVFATNWMTTKDQSFDLLLLFQPRYGRWYSGNLLLSFVFLINQSGKKNEVESKIASYMLRTNYWLK